MRVSESEGCSITNNGNLLAGVERVWTARLIQLLPCRKSALIGRINTDLHWAVIDHWDTQD
jgi:hypothetical protein